MYNRELEKKLATKQLSLGEYECVRIICIKDYTSSNGRLIWLKSDNFYYYSKATYFGPCHIYDINYKFLFAQGVDFLLEYFQFMGDYRNKRIDRIFKD